MTRKTLAWKSRKARATISLEMKTPSTSSYTTLELIFAIIVVSTGALALSFALVELRNSESASKTTLNLVTLEQRLVSDLVNPSLYDSPNVKQALRSDLAPPIRFSLSPQASIAPNETVFLNRDLKTCSGYPIGECGYKIRLQFETQPLGYSYEIASSFAEAALSLSRSGRDEVVIPRAYYRDPNRVVCDPRREVGLTALSSSDRYQCLSRPQKSCARGTLPKSFAVVDGALELECGPPTRLARCPAFYSLNGVDTRSLEASGSKSVSCVRTTASVASPSVQPAPSLRVVGRACPMGYRSQSTCTLVNVTSKPGRCGAGVAQPVAGRLRFTENQPAAGSVDCGVDLQAQTCGAIWMGYAQLKISCVLDQPEFADAL